MPFTVCVSRSGFVHPKNRHGFGLLAAHARASRAWALTDDPEAADVVWSPSAPLPFPKAKRVFYGPHFSVFPEASYFSLPARDARLVYVVPSEWCQRFWRDECGARHVPVRVAPFPVDVDRFAPDPAAPPRTKCFVYVKRRADHEVSALLEALVARGLHPRIFDYDAGYEEATYLGFLRTSRFGAWIGCSESQGFALEEALATDVPLLVWSTTSMAQEDGQQQAYAHVRTRSTTVPYWDARCGEVFTAAHEIAPALDTFLARLHAGRYAPRAFVLENLSAPVVYERYWAPLMPTPTGTTPSP